MTRQLKKGSQETAGRRGSCWVAATCVGDCCLCWEGCTFPDAGSKAIGARGDFSLTETGGRPKKMMKKKKKKKKRRTIKTLEEEDGGINVQGVSKSP